MNKKRFRINVTFRGTASLDIEAQSPDEARQLARELTIPDLARPSIVDILSFEIAAREITASAALHGESHLDDDEAEDRPRPSGWYRPA